MTQQGSTGRRCRSDRGAAAVEFALVSGIVLLLLVGIVQFGLLYWQQLQVTYAAQEGARWAAIGSVDASVTARTIAAAAPLPIKSSDVTISRPTSMTVTVTVRYSSNLLSGLTRQFFGGANRRVLQSSATQRIQ